MLAKAVTELQLYQTTAAMTRHTDVTNKRVLPHSNSFTVSTEYQQNQL